MSKKKKTQNQRNGCLFFIYLIFNIGSLMGILVGIMTYRSTIRLISLVNNAEEIELKTFYIESYTTKGTGGKGWSGILHVFKGTVEGVREAQKASATSNLDLNYRSIEKIIEKKQMKVWYLERKGRDFVFIQKMRPTKQELMNYLWWSLSVTFIVPLLLLIRLSVLYKLGRFDLPKTQ